MRTVKVTSPVEKRCPYTDEADVGTVTLTFEVEKDAPELHEMAATLDTWAEIAISHEDFTAAVLRRWSDEGCSAARSTWRTAGMWVTVDVPR